MGSPSVRAARPGDRAAWLEMRIELWPDDADAHERDVDRFFAGISRNPEEVLIAEVDGRPAGYVELSIRAYAEGCVTDRVAYIEGWFVQVDERRTGVGRGLVEGAERWGREQGCSEIASDAAPDNDVSLFAHRACGFDREARVVCFAKAL